MKSRTSFFNGAVFRKDLRRFAPAWVLYMVCLLMGVTVIVVEASRAYHRAAAVADIIPFMSFVNLIYALINAQLFFGDLFNARLCNALHAMPLRRECWYGTHLAAGLCFSLVPNAFASLLGLAISNLGVGWSVALWWFAGTSLQYLCFFGIAVFCMMLTGHRFAAVLVYTIINFFSLLVYWLVDSLYEPLLTGIRIAQEPFNLFSPMVQMIDDHYLVEVMGERIVDEQGYFSEYIITGIELGSWWPLCLYALLGIALMGLSLVMYRKRQLECAGDFMAFQFTEPILLVIYTVTCGGFLHIFSEAFTGIPYLFLAVGLIVGFFTGLMLLQRTTRVFTRRAFIQLGIFIGVFALTLVLAVLDPLGITRWVPAAEDVVSVNLSTRYEINSYSEGEIDLTEEADILAMIGVHAGSIAEGDNADAYIETYGYYITTDFCLEYTMADGSVRQRFYEVHAESDMSQQLKPYFSSFEYVTGYTEDQIPELAKQINYLYTEELRDNSSEYRDRVAAMDMEAMLRAIAADCAAGNMAQVHSYHTRIEEGETYGFETFLEFGIERSDGRYTGIVDYVNLHIYPECTNTLDWMTENGLYNPNAIKG